MNEKSVLIVESDTVVALELKSCLAKLGRQGSAIVNTGEWAIEEIRKQVPEMIFIDIELQGQLDGIETARLISAESEIPVIFLTASNSEVLKDNSNRVMPYGYVVKPIQADALKASIDIAQYAEKLIKLEKKTKQAFGFTEQKLHSIFSYSSNYVIQLDSWLKVRYINKDIFGLSPLQIIGTSILNYLSSTEKKRIKSILDETYKTEEPATFSCGLTGPDQSSLLLKIYAVSWKNPFGDHKNGLLLNCQNITNHIDSVDLSRKDESESKQYQKMEALGSMISRITHDFNGLLHPILAFATMGLRKTEENVDIQSYFNSISVAANRAQSLVQQILTFSRKDELDLKPIQLQSVIREVLEIQRISLPTNIHVETEIEKDFPVIIADETKIHQVLMNLTTNARHAMQESGGVLKVSLKTDASDPGKVLKLESGGNNYFCLTVSDTGTGIAPEIAKKIFDPFFSTKSKSKGSGLGLSIVSNIIKSHNGMIEVSSVPEKETQFKMFLPLLKTPISITEVEKAKKDIKGHEKILIVDVEQSVISLYTKTMQPFGYRITGMTDSRKALSHFTNRPAEFDMVISDLQMPGLNGFQLALSIFNLRPDIPILLCSGTDHSVDEKRAKAIGITKYLIKPVEPLHLTTMVRNILDE